MNIKNSGIFHLALILTLAAAAHAQTGAGQAQQDKSYYGNFFTDKLLAKTVGVWKFSANGFATMPPLPGSSLWLGENHDCLFITNDIAYLETAGDHNFFLYRSHGDTMELIRPQHDDFTSGGISMDSSFGLCFRCAHQDAESIVLRPCHDKLLYPLPHGVGNDRLFDTSATFTLYQPRHFVDTNLTFDRLCFAAHHRTKYDVENYTYTDRGLSTYYTSETKDNQLWMIIDSTKHLYLYGNDNAMEHLGFDLYRKKDAFKAGYYQGVLSDSLYQALITILRNSPLDWFSMGSDPANKFPVPHVQDEATYTFEIYYNNTSKRTVGCRFPFIMTPLNEYLSSIRLNVPLTKLKKNGKQLFDNYHP